MFLADGVSKLRCSDDLTDHTKSCFYIYKQFHKDFKYDVQKITNGHIIEITGIGMNKTVANEEEKIKEDKAKEQEETKN